MAPPRGCLPLAAAAALWIALATFGAPADAGGGASVETNGTAAAAAAYGWQIGRAHV